MPWRRGIFSSTLPARVSHAAPASRCACSVAWTSSRRSRRRRGLRHRAPSVVRCDFVMAFESKVDPERMSRDLHTRLTQFGRRCSACACSTARSPVSGLLLFQGRDRQCGDRGCGLSSSRPWRLHRDRPRRVGRLRRVDHFAARPSAAVSSGACTTRQASHSRRASTMITLHHCLSARSSAASDAGGAHCRDFTGRTGLQRHGADGNVSSSIHMALSVSIAPIPIPPSERLTNLGMSGTFSSP